jgi:hypothetical protein
MASTSSEQWTLIPYIGRDRTLVWCDEMCFSGLSISPAFPVRLILVASGKCGWLGRRLHKAPIQNGAGQMQDMPALEQ